MKKYRKSKKFLEELCLLPNVSVVCKNLGIARNTVYQWREKDPVFRKEMDKAMQLGEETGNDLAHSKLFLAMQRGEKWAVKYWLDNHHKNYVRPRPKGLIAELMGVKRPEGFEVIIRHGKNEPTSSRGKTESNQTTDTVGS